MNQWVIALKRELMSLRGGHVPAIQGGLDALSPETARALLQVISELKRELFGPKSDRLTPEQQEQLSKLNQDLAAEAGVPMPCTALPGRCPRPRRGPGFCH